MHPQGPAQPEEALEWGWWNSEALAEVGLRPGTTQLDEALMRVGVGLRPGTRLAGRGFVGVARRLLGTLQPMEAL